MLAKDNIKRKMAQAKNEHRTCPNILQRSTNKGKKRYLLSLVTNERQIKPQ